MTVKDYLERATKDLANAGIGTARLDALVLLEDVTAKDRAWLLANPQHAIPPAQALKLKKLLKARARHTPLAYVRGHTEFYGRNFVITPAVLEPRPESETMIELLKKLGASGSLRPAGRQPAAKNGPGQAAALRIADVGAGSGALGITAKLELSPLLKVAVDLLEIDPEALKVAKTNIDKYTTSVSAMESDLLAGSAQNYDVLLCNLPYVPDGHTVNRAALHEPRLAIFGGPDGLDIYRRLFKQISKTAHRPLYILCESLPPQHEALASIAAGAGYHTESSEDFIQVFKYAA
jgi:release factor glutamine methyltransferase